MLDIGKKIRALRLGNNLTQEELANRLELTKGYISQLENNLTSPSIQTLFAILEVLGVEPYEFFSKPEDEDAKIVFTKEDYYEKESPELGSVISWIVPNALKYEMEPIIIEIKPGGQSTIDDSHPGEEFGYVLEGQVTLVLNKKRFIVKKGETFYYMANKEHYIINTGNSIAKVLWISTPPMF
ncbi:helix-turn-helix transcriptional regulator [Acholeplasma equirhinis]|uniref:helix-turn-helix domain-containing protein n=1 Tax=Acholeplasma equirhinis TaxID=555393 RepID=UPI00197B03B0|nr:XRE family transcriptional regulator [Acholeplasma equirhinis]MBN3491157.1 helix-turn-helix transcriptional regulator [Acholeplasma equirhinis]